MCSSQQTIMFPPPPATTITFFSLFSNRSITGKKDRRYSSLSTVFADSGSAGARDALAPPEQKEKQNEYASTEWSMYLLDGPERHSSRCSFGGTCKRENVLKNDNDFLLHGHRPPNAFFPGCLFFLFLGLLYMFRPNMPFVAPVQEKVAVGMFFLGAILCLSFSWLFHTVYCHRRGFFFKQSLFFYCSSKKKVHFMGVAAQIHLQCCDFFATPQSRGVRAGHCRRVFVGLGLSGVVPTLHFVISEGLIRATTIGQIGLSSGPASPSLRFGCLVSIRSKHWAHPHNQTRHNANPIF
uniref:Adiponectin receptor 2 n=1 Tax=Hippocampus comes TaxID=109280 RepID=A0A3Q3E1Q3_HIPCM